MFHVGGLCWREIRWLILRQLSPRGSHTMRLGTSVKGHSSIQSPLLYPSLVCLDRRESTAAKVLPGRLRKGYLFPSHVVKPSTFAYTETATSRRYLSCYGKIACINTCPFQLTTFSALKLDSKNNLLFRELLSALMHRAETSMGAKIRIIQEALT